jgi:glutamyl-tRNA reductase
MRGYISVGVSWRTAPLPLLERVAVGGQAREALLRRVLAAGCSEALVLSTCSRTELHVIREDTEPPIDLVGLLVGAQPDVARALARVASTSGGPRAVEHLFRVASGLESRAVGEVEIQGQLRAAARAALARSGEPQRLRGLVRAALDSARSAPVSALGARRGLLARRAVARAVATAPAGGLDVVVVGAGTIGHQVLEALPARRCSTTLLSRCPTAATSARPEVRPLEELPAHLGTADLVFVATSAGRHLLTRAAVHRAVRSRPRPVTLVDLAVPRNIDPAVSLEPSVRLLDLDDLDAGELSQADVPLVAAATSASEEGAARYLESLRVRRAGPLISALRPRIEETCLAKLRAGLRDADVPDEVLAGVAASVAGAMAHAPTLLLRAAAGQGDQGLLDHVAAAFGLPRDLAPPAAGSTSAQATVPGPPPSATTG